MSLYQRLKASQTSTQEEGNLIKTSQTSHAHAGRRGIEQLSSYKCDIRATSTPVKENKSPSRAQVTNGTLSESVSEPRIIAWINSNPPDLPDVQNNCAACGEFIPVYDTGWVILGDRSLIHYSGKYGLKCWKAWKAKRRTDALASINLKGSNNI
jgi:hypothetical protein